MENYDATAMGYSQHSCSGGCVGGYSGGGDLPTVQDIANFNAMTPEQQLQMRQELYEANQNTFHGLPFQPSSRWAANAYQAPASNGKGLETKSNAQAGAAQVMPKPNAQAGAAVTAPKPNTQAGAAQTTPRPNAQAGAAQTAPKTNAQFGSTLAEGSAGVSGMEMLPPHAPGTDIQQVVDHITPTSPITPTTMPAPIPGNNLEFLNGFLRTQIGRPVLVSFLIGTNTVTDRSGILLAVGTNYILLNEAQTDDILACDFYNIKFVTFYY